MKTRETNSAPQEKSDYTDLYAGTGKPCAGQSNVKLWFDLVSSPCILATDENFGTELPTGSMKWKWKQILCTKCVTTTAE